MSEVTIEPLSVPADTNILQYDATQFNQYLSGSVNKNTRPLSNNNMFDSLANLTNLYDVISTLTDKNKNNENILSFDPITKHIYRVPDKNIVLKKGYQMPILRDLEKIQLVQYGAYTCGGAVKVVPDNLSFVGVSKESLQSRYLKLVTDLKSSVILDPLAYLFDSSPNHTSVWTGLKSMRDSFDTILWSTIGIPENKTISHAQSVLLNGRSNPFIYPITGGIIDFYKNMNISQKTSVLKELFCIIVTYDTIKKENDLYRSTQIFHKFDSMMNPDKTKYTDDMSLLTVKRMYINVIYLLRSLYDLKQYIITTNNFSNTDGHAHTTNTYILEMCLESLSVIKGSIEHIIKYKNYDIKHIMDNVSAIDLIHSIFINQNFSNLKSQFVDLSEAQTEKSLDPILTSVRDLIDYYDLLIGFDLEKYVESICNKLINSTKNKFIDRQSDTSQFIDNLITTSNDRYDELVLYKNVDLNYTNIQTQLTKFFNFDVHIDLEDLYRSDTMFLEKIKPKIVSNILCLVEGTRSDPNLSSIPNTSDVLMSKSNPEQIIDQGEILFEIKNMQSSDSCFNGTVLRINQKNQDNVYSDSNYISIHRFTSNFVPEFSDRVAVMDLMTDGTIFYGIPLVRSFISNNPTDRSELDHRTLVATPVVYMLYKETGRLKGTIVVMTDEGCYFYDTLCGVVAELGLKQKIMVDELKTRALIDIGIDSVKNNGVDTKNRAIEIANKYTLKPDFIKMLIKRNIHDTTICNRLIQCVDILNTSSTIQIPVTHRYATISDKFFDHIPVNIVDDGMLINLYATNKTIVGQQFDHKINIRNNSDQAIMVYLSDTDTDMSRLDRRCFYGVKHEPMDNQLSPVIVHRTNDTSISLDIKLDRSKRYCLVFAYDDPQDHGVKNHHARIINTETFDGLMIVDKNMFDSNSSVHIKLDIPNLSSDTTKNISARLYKMNSGIFKQDGITADNSLNQPLEKYIIDSGFATTYSDNINTYFGWKVSWIINKAHYDTEKYITQYFDSIRLTDLYTNVKYFDNKFIKDDDGDSSKIVVKPLIKSTIPYKIMMLNRYVEKLFEKEIKNHITPSLNNNIAKIMNTIFAWVFVSGAYVWYYLEFLLKVFFGGLGIFFVPLFLFIMNVLIVFIINPLIGDISNPNDTSRFRSYSPFFSAIFVQFGYMGLGKIIYAIFRVLSSVVSEISVVLHRYLFSYLPSCLYTKIISYFIWREGRDFINPENIYRDSTDYYPVVQTDDDIYVSNFVDRHRSKSSSTSNGSDYVMDITKVFSTNVMKHVYMSYIDEVKNNLSPLFEKVAADTTVSTELNNCVSKLYGDMIGSVQQLKTKTSQLNLQKLIDAIVHNIPKDSNNNPVDFLSAQTDITKNITSFVSPDAIKKTILELDSYKYDVKEYDKIISLCKNIVLPTKVDVLRLLANCERYIDAVTGLHGGGSVLLFLDKNMSSLKSRQFIEYILSYVQSTVHTMTIENNKTSLDVQMSDADILKIYDIHLCDVPGLKSLIDSSKTQLLNLPLCAVFSVKQNMIALYTLSQHNVFSPEKFPYSIHVSDQQPIPHVVQYTEYSIRLRNIIIKDDSNLNFYNALKTTISEYASGIKIHPYIKEDNLILNNYFAGIEADPTTDNDKRSKIGYILKRIYELSSPFSDSLSNYKISNTMSNNLSHEIKPNPNIFCRLLLSKESISLPRKTPIGFVRATAKNLVDLTKSNGDVLYNTLVNNTEFVVGEQILGDIENDINIDMIINNNQ